MDSTQEKQNKPCAQNNNSFIGSVTTVVCIIMCAAINGILEGHCDLCWGRHNFRGMMLQRCRDCGVNFHCECYGVVAAHSEKDPQIQCFACKAVGKTFHVRDRDNNNKRIAVTVKERPTECCLCGTNNGEAFLHAMHPVFDDHGPRGRQILLRATKRKPQRLAWAHTLCCAAICSLMNGCVYGCKKDGSYEGEGAESQVDKDDDDESVNSALAMSMMEDTAAEDYADITHYVYTLPKNPKRDEDYQPWLHLIAETKRELRCILCGKNDNPKGVYRLAVQCCANDEKEFKEFRGYHRDLHGDTCFQPMHVGCALFRKEEDGSWPSEKRVFFFPGSSKKGAKYQEPIVNVFCDAHARDIRVNRPLSAPKLAPPVYNNIVYAPVEDRKPASEGNSSKTTAAHVARAGTRAVALNTMASEMTAALHKGTASALYKPILLGQSFHNKPTASEKESRTKNGPLNDIDSSANPSLDTMDAGPKSNKRARLFKISECKLDQYEDTELEQKFHEIVQDVQSHVVGQSGLIESLDESKAEWKEKLSVPLTVFTSLWAKVEKTVLTEAERVETEMGREAEQEERASRAEEEETKGKADGDESDAEQEETASGREEAKGKADGEESDAEQVETEMRFDWSCLIIGPNFNPGYDFSRGEIREEY